MNSDALSEWALFLRRRKYPLGISENMVREPDFMYELPPLLPPPPPSLTRESSGPGPPGGAPAFSCCRALSCSAGSNSENLRWYFRKLIVSR